VNRSGPYYRPKSTWLQLVGALQTGTCRQCEDWIVTHVP